MEKLISEGNTMVLVFILLGILIFLGLCIVLLLFSAIVIEVKDLKLENRQIKNKTKRRKEYKIKLGVYLGGKIPLFYFRLDPKKVNKIYQSKQFQKIDLKKMEKKVYKREIFTILKYSKIQLKNLYLNMQLGIEDVVITSYLVAIISSFIGNLLPHFAKQNTKNCYYQITPIYQNNNEYQIELEGIIVIKIIHILYGMYVIKKKGRKKNERTSNRRSYAYRYE